MLQRGKINFHEFKYGLENLHIRLTRTQLEKLFKILDKNKDGFLSFPEFSLLAKGSLKEIIDDHEQDKQNVYYFINNIYIGIYIRPQENKE